MTGLKGQEAFFSFKLHGCGCRDGHIEDNEYVAVRDLRVVLRSDGPEGGLGLQGMKITKIRK